MSHSPGPWEVSILCRVKGKYPYIIFSKFNTNDDTLEWVDLPTYKVTGKQK